MSQSQVGKAEAAEERTEQTRSFVRRVRAATRRKYIPEEKIRIVLEGGHVPSSGVRVRHRVAVV